MPAIHLRKDPRALVLAIVQLYVAGIRPTGVVLMQALLDLATYPSVIPELMKEVYLIRGGSDRPLAPYETSL